MAEQLEFDFMTPEQKEIAQLKARILALELEINALRFKGNYLYNPCEPPYNPWFGQIVCKGPTVEC